jgi:hypothetical protein
MMRLQSKNEPSDGQDSCKYGEYAVKDSQQGVVRKLEA